MYCLTKTGLKSNGLSEHSCSDSHMAQCCLERSQSTLMDNWAAFLWSINFLMARVTESVICGSALKFNSSEVVCSLEVSLAEAKNFLRCIRLSTFDLPFNKRFLAGPCHFGVNLGFLRRGEKSSYHTKCQLKKSVDVRICQKKFSPNFDLQWQCFLLENKFFDVVDSIPQM